MSTVPKRKRSEARQRTVLVAFRLLPEEAVLVRSAAAERGMGLSEYIRSSALSRAESRRAEVSE